MKARNSLIWFWLICFPAFAANLKLYMKDGGFHIAREYKIDNGRVKFYSVERSQWEEVPAELVDLPRTSAENAQKAATLAEEAKIISEEDKAVRALRDEIVKIPQDPGVYTLEGPSLKEAKLNVFKPAESKIHTNKGRSVLKAVAPIPIVSGKATVEIDNDHSLNIVHNDRQEFYIQLEGDQRFGIVKLTPHHGVRIVERLTILPVVKEAVEEMDQVPIFRKQLTESGLYKIWPEKPLEPDEYAVVEYIEGKMNTQIWDFAYKK